MSRPRLRTTNRWPENGPYLSTDCASAHGPSNDFRMSVGVEHHFEAPPATCRHDRAHLGERNRRHQGPCVAGEQARQRYRVDNVPELISAEDLALINEQIDAALLAAFGYPIVHPHPYKP